jgi:hypothetical protein
MHKAARPKLPPTIVIGVWWVCIGLDGLIAVLIQRTKAMAIPAVSALAIIQVSFLFCIFGLVARSLGDISGLDASVRRKTMQLLYLATRYPGALGLVLAVVLGQYAGGPR